MKAKSDKSHLFLSTEAALVANIKNEIISNNEIDKLLGVTIDYQLNFDEHVSSLSVKAGQKLNALTRISSFMNQQQRKQISWGIAI